jgi:hypothetical protein
VNLWLVKQGVGEWLSRGLHLAEPYKILIFYRFLNLNLSQFELVSIGFDGCCLLAC